MCWRQQGKFVERTLTSFDAIQFLTLADTKKPIEITSTGLNELRSRALEINHYFYTVCSALRLLAVSNKRTGRSTHPVGIVFNIVDEGSNFIPVTIVSDR